MEAKKALAAIAAAPILAPILALLESRTFVSGVIAFGVNLLVAKEPTLAPYQGMFQAMLLIIWVGLAGKFSIEKFIDAWTNKPGTPDQAQADILSELTKALKALVDAVLNGGLPTTPATGQTVTVNATVPELTISNKEG